MMGTFRNVAERDLGARIYRLLVAIFSKCQVEGAKWGDDN
jgi:hypothetical protein